MMIIIVSVAP